MRLDSRPVLQEAQPARPALSRAELESDAAEMALQGADAAYVDLQVLIDAFTAPRRVPTTIAEQRASLAAHHVRAGVDSAFTRALETSERRRERAERDREYLDWVSYCFAKKSKITLAEWRAMP